MSDWYDRAACRGLGDVMYPSPETRGPDLRLAKKLCLDCPVRAECLADALAYDTEHGTRDVLFGVRAGLGTRERDAHRAGAPIRHCPKCGLLYVSATGAAGCGACTPAVRRADRAACKARFAELARELADLPMGCARSPAGRYLRQARAERAHEFPASRPAGPVQQQRKEPASAA